MTEDITTISAGQLDAVERSLSVTERDGAATTVSTLSQVYRTSVTDVWDACTSKDRLPRWFAPVSGDLELGGRYQVEGNAGGTIEVCEPPSAFRISWEFGGGVSWVTVRIDPVGEDATRLTLEHTATEALPNEFWQTYGPGATGVGWDLALLGLALHLETGADKPAENSEWEQSDAAREFIGNSSRRWADAAVAAGTPEEEARAAGRNTTAFYTGQPAD